MKVWKCGNGGTLSIFNILINHQIFTYGREKYYCLKILGFSVEIVKYCELLESKRKDVVAKQLLRSGTSVGANVFESQHAESKADFIHKLSMALKEANESDY